MMALSGVRSSWLTVARKRPLDSSACSAARRGALELLGPALVLGDVAGDGDDGDSPRRRQRPRRLDAMGAGLDPDHPRPRAGLSPLGRSTMEPEFDRDRLVAQGGVADRLEEGRAGRRRGRGERSPRPTSAAGAAPRSFVAAALALTTWPLRSCQVTRSSIAWRSERSRASRRRAAARRLHLDCGNARPRASRRARSP